MTFQLPSDSASQFKDFFTQLDAALDVLGIRSYGVGITTLEEVFLKIAEDTDEAHGEPTTNKEELKEDRGLLKVSDLDDYSIVEQHEEGYMNNFFLSLKALLKKKFLVQVRDPRTLVIEMLFPIIFIFAGLALATRKPIMPGIPRVLTPTMLPSPSHLVFNEQIPGGLITQNDLIDFSFTEKFWDLRKSVEVDVTSKPKDLEYMVSPLDNYLFIN
jgi:ATP-binding cassette subfamily A (ABC1) protein 3